MISLSEIEESILELESMRDTTFATCSRLADLYTVRNNLKGGPQSQPRPLSLPEETELYKSIDGKDSVKVWKVMNELAETLEITNPKLYANLISKLQQI